MCLHLLIHIILCCVFLQSGCLWWQWCSAVYCSCCWLGFAGVSAVLTPAAATSAAGAALTRAAAPDTVSVNTDEEELCPENTDSCLNEIVFYFLVYEAGKGIKSGTSSPQTPAYPPYFVSGVPTMVPIAPPSLVDKVSSVPPSDGTLVAAGEVMLFVF